MRVWIVFEGTYSDRGVVGVYDNQEAADNHRSNSHEWVGNPNMDIEEWEVGAACARIDRQVWNVCMNRDGQALPFFPHDTPPARREPDDHEEYEPRIVRRYSQDNPYVLWVVKEARSAEHIVKIANEIRTQWVASGEWDTKVAEVMKGSA